MCAGSGDGTDTRAGTAGRQPQPPGICPPFSEVNSLFQIQKVMFALGDYMNVKVHACIGGTSVRDDQRKLESGVHVVVGTPGRVNDMICRGILCEFAMQ